MTRNQNTAPHCLFHRTALALILFGLVPLIALAGDDARHPASDSVPAAGAEEAVPRSLLTLTEVEVARLSPMVREIRTVLLSEQNQVEALTAQIAGAQDDAESFALQRKIAAVKLQAEIEVMEVQARHAETAGHGEQAANIREAIAPLKVRAERHSHSDGAQR